jgi:hypothetical protein
MFPQNPSERCGTPADSDLVRILLSLNDLVRLQLMAPNNIVWINVIQIELIIKQTCPKKKPQSKLILC